MIPQYVIDAVPPDTHPGNVRFCYDTYRWQIYGAGGVWMDIEGLEPEPPEQPDKS